MKYCSAHISVVLVLGVVLVAPSAWSLRDQAAREDLPKVAWSLRDQAAREVLPKVACFSRRIRAEFGPLVRTNLHVKDLSGAKVPVPEDEGPCGVWKTERPGGAAFYTRYDSCYVQTQGSSVLVPLVVQLQGGDLWVSLNISCPLVRGRAGGRAGGRPRPTPTPLPGKCDVVPALRVPCGPPPVVSMETCGGLGCCFDSQDAVCYYRLNACSTDGHFVFSVAARDAEPPLDPRTLGVRGHPDCLPAVVTGDVAVFKIPRTDCGARMRLQGDVLTYEVDVESLQTDHSPFSLQVQCEYEGPGVRPAPAVITNPPPLVAMGTVGVQMRIARDSSFADSARLPMAFPLRSPVYVEVSIQQPAPEPDLSLRVQDCFAYPASRTSVWTLLYDGCPNPLDSPRTAPLVDPPPGGAPSQVRRFEVKTFAFLDPQTGQHSTEEIYFYCWVEICTADTDCTQPCSLASSEDRRRRRRRREVRSDEVRSDGPQLVSLGPLLLGYDDTNPENPCTPQKTMLQVTLYSLGAVGVVLLVFIIIIRSCVRKPGGKRERDCHAPGPPTNP